MYLGALTKDEYFIEKKEIEGNIVEVYDTPFGHKIIVTADSLSLKELENKFDNTKTIMAILACLVLFLPLFLIYLILK